MSSEVFLLLPNIKNFPSKIEKPAEEAGFWLSRQVSNLNSSDPESDVLPITPRDNFEVANINKKSKIKNCRPYELNDLQLY